MRRHIAPALAAMLTLASAPAHADDLFGGFYGHAVLEAHGREQDSFDTSVGYRTDPIPWLSLIFSPDIHAIVSINSKYRTDFGAVGLDWRIKLSRHFYFRPGIGLAYTNGEADPPPANAPGLTPAEENARLHIYQTRINFGDPILFEPELALGYAFNKKWALEVSYIHLSNGQILHQGTNEGVDDIGLRLNYHFH